LEAGANAKAKYGNGKTVLDYVKDNSGLKGTDVLKQLEEASKWKVAADFGRCMTFG
jgi:hypothetical protein